MEKRDKKIKPAVVQGPKEPKCHGQIVQDRVNKQRQISNEVANTLPAPENPYRGAKEKKERK